jgi:hypothetical protein
MTQLQDSDLTGPATCPVCGRPGNCCAERDRYREALYAIAPLAGVAGTPQVVSEKLRGIISNAIREDR